MTRDMNGLRLVPGVNVDKVDGYAILAAAICGGGRQGNTMIVKCRVCGRKLRCDSAPDDDYTLRETARSVLRDPGTPGDGTGGYLIVMPYVISMSEKAGPYCPADALKQVNKLNQAVTRP